MLLEDVGTGSVGDVAHGLEGGFEATAVVDPAPVELGILGAEQPGDGAATLLPRQLVVGAVAVVGVDAAAVRVGA